MAAYDSDIQLTVDLDPGDVINTAKDINESIEEIFEKTKNKNTPPSFKSMEVSMSKLLQKSRELQSKLDILGARQIESPDYTKIKADLEELQIKYEELQKTKEEYETNRIQPDSVFGRKLIAELGDTIVAMKTLEAQKSALEANDLAVFPGSETQEYEDIINQLNQVNNQLIIYRQKAIEAGHSMDIAMEDNQQEIETTDSRLSTLFGNFTDWAQRTRELGSQVFNGLKFALQSINSLPITVFSRIVSATKIAVGHLNNLSRSLLKVVSGTIISGLAKIRDSLTGIGKSARSSNNGLNIGLKTFLRYGLGVRSVFALVNKLRRALVEGFKNLAKSNEEFNESLSQITSSLEWIKNSFAAAFAPLIETLAPVINTLAEKLVNVIRLSGQFIAAITGKNALEAQYVYTDYAKSLDNSSKATSKLNKKSKELKKTLAGFDDVEILKDNKEDDDEEIAEDAFITSPISSALSNLANSLLDAWKNADFSQLGRLVGEKLLAALNKIPWDRIKNVLRKIAKSIATFLNGFLETPGLFTAIGKTIAEALNSAFEFVESFVSNFHWDSLGIAIKDAILGVINNIDWELIYKTLRELGAGIGTTIENAFNNPEIWSGIFTTLSNLLNSIVNGLNAFIASVDWGSTAANIAQGLNDGIKNFDWKTLADTLSAIINNIFDAWYNFITTFDFAEFGRRIGQTIADTIRGIDWELGGMNVGLTINKLFEALDNAIQNIPWAELGQSIKTFILSALTSINWDTIYQTMTNVGIAIGTTLQNALNNPQIWTEALTAIARGFNAIVYSIRAFIQSIEWGELGNNIATGINKMVNTVDWDAVADTLVSGINGAIAFFTNAVTTLNFHEIGEHIGSTVSKVIKGINWKEGAYSIGLCATNLYDAINGAMETIVWEDVGKAIVDIIAGYFDGLDWNTLGKFASNCLHALLGTLTGAIEEVDWINVANEVGEKIGDFLVGFDWDQAAHDTMELLGAALTAAILVVTGLGKAIADWIIDGLTKMWDFFGTEIEDAGGDIGQGILNGIADIFKNIGGWLVENVVNPIVEGLASTIDIRRYYKSVESGK